MTLPTATPAALPAGVAGPRLGGNVAGAASMVVWAAGFPAADALLATWDPFAVLVGRLAMALLLLAPLVLLLEGVPRGRGGGGALLTGALGIGGGAAALVFAQAATDPVTVAVIASSSPILATLVERAFARGPLSRGFLLGLAASVVGGVVATAGTGAGAGNLPLGVGLALLSCLLYAWGSHESVRRLPGRSALAQTTVSVAGAFAAALTMLAVALALGRDAWPPATAGAADLGLLAIYGMGAMAASQLLFIVAVRSLGVGLASFHTNIAPFYVMLILLALGGAWSWPQAAGAAIVALGVVVAQR